MDYKTGKQDSVSDMDTYIGNVRSVSLMKLVEGSIVVNEEAQFYVKKQPVLALFMHVMKEEMFHAYTRKKVFCNSQKLLLYQR